jgi:integrase
VKEHVIVKKEPITPDILQTIVLLYGNENGNLKDLRIACMCLLGYAGFLRFSELASLKRSDISFFPSYVKLYLEKRKTDVYREGREVVISKTGTITGPVVYHQHRSLQLQWISNYEDQFSFV